MFRPQVTLEFHIICQIAIRNSFVADALAMPVHWFYRIHDIQQFFPNGIDRFYDAPHEHPSSIMSLHSKQQGGRKNFQADSASDVVGEVILKGKAQFWNQSHIHYHHGMHAGENTLNAYTVLWLLQSIKKNGKGYNEADFLSLYIDNMMSENPLHPDTYAESYHRGFFANLMSGKPSNQCGAVTHDTSSVGGMVRVGPMVLFMLSKGTDVVTCKSVVAMHLKLTHPDAKLTQVCFQYIDLIVELMKTEGIEERGKVINRYLKQVAGRHFKRKPAAEWTDNQVVGGLYSTACYITDSWPAVLFLASKYASDSKRALQVNAELGGDNVHRGAVLAVLLSLINHQSLDDLYLQLDINEKLDPLLCDLFN